MNGKWVAAAAAMSVMSLAGAASAYERLQGPTELLYWDQANAYNGLTLFGAAGKTYLIDMSGNVVHTWDKVGTNPHLLADGSILDASKDDPSGFGGFQIVDWDGNVTWNYTESRIGYSPHHDFIRIYNSKLQKNTTVYIANKTISQAEAIAAGADPAKGPYDGSQMDTLVEVDDDGTVVWEWRFFDHVIQDVDATKPNYVGSGKTIKDSPGRININMPGRPLRTDWLHCNSLDYNPTLDQLVTNSVQGEFYVIDHGGTFVAGDPDASIAAAASAKGDFLYRFGDPARYGQGDPPSILEDWTVSTAGHKQIGGAHHISWIEQGLPGAGHFLIFNNGQFLFEHTPQSYIHEINGFLDAGKNDTGAYVNPPAAGYTKVDPVNRDTHKVTKNASNQIVWTYNTKSNQAFFSHIGGSAQRLPNGNTLICSDTEGHLFEVTSDGTLVWEYINPVTRDGAFATLSDNYPMTNSVFRAYRYAVDNPAFVGRDLTPQGTITGTSPAPDAGAGGSTQDAGVGGSAQAGAGGAQDPGSSGAAGVPSNLGCPPTSSSDSGGCSTSGNGSASGVTLLLMVGAFFSGFLMSRRGARMR